MVRHPPGSAQIAGITCRVNRSIECSASSRGDVAEGETAEQVVQPAVVDGALQEVAHLVRRAGDRAAFAPRPPRRFRGTARSGWAAACCACATASGSCRAICRSRGGRSPAPPFGVGDHDVAADAHQRQSCGALPERRPFGAIAIGERAHAGAADVADDVDAVLHRPGHRIRPADAVPQRRMRLLERLISIGTSRYW